MLSTLPSLSRLLPRVDDLAVRYGRADVDNGMKIINYVFRFRHLCVDQFQISELE